MISCGLRKCISLLAPLLKMRCFPPRVASIILMAVTKKCLREVKLENASLYWSSKVKPLATAVVTALWFRWKLRPFEASRVIMSTSTIFSHAYIKVFSSVGKTDNISYWKRRVIFTFKPSKLSWLSKTIVSRFNGPLLLFPVLWRCSGIFNTLLDIARVSMASKVYPAFWDPTRHDSDRNAKSQWQRLTPDENLRRRFLGRTREDAMSSGGTSFAAGVNCVLRPIP